MSALDHIKVFLPDFPKEHQGLLFQTKGINRDMSEYEVRADGLLYKRVCKTEWVHDDASPFGGCLHVVSEKWLPDMTLDETIEIYMSTPEGPVRYNLMFLDGKCVTVQRLLIPVQ
jgi:hypothetical protein